MGLDMYAYVATREGQQNDYYEGAEWDENTKDYVNKNVSKPREIAYWRKHPTLHGWMEKLAEKKSLRYSDFNGVELELTWDDIDKLEKDIKSGAVARMNTTGFFFGKPSDDYYYDTDLEFIKIAKAEIFVGLKVFYNSSW